MSQSRRYTNRSGSGSEEIKQIFGSQNGISGSIPQEQVNYSSGLLGWMRNALLPASSSSPSSSSSNRSGTSPNRQSSHGHMTILPYATSENDPVERQDTPLLPGIVPSFHRQLEERREEQVDTLSRSYDESPDTSGWSLEPLDRAKRRPSVISAISTLEDDAGSSNSSDEDVYTPFTANEDFPRLGAQRNDSLPPIDNINEDADEANTCYSSKDTTYSTLTKNDGADHQNFNALKLASKPRLNLTIGQARNAQETVEDIRPRPQRAPSVILTSSDRASSDARPMSPTAGWTDEFKTPIELNFTLPLSLQDASTTASTKEITPLDDDAGDGEDYEDRSGTPLSPQEIANLRPSRESVVLGSRGAHTRMIAKYNRLSTTKQVDEKVDEWDDSRSKTPLALNPISNAITPIPEVEPSDSASSNTLVDTMAPQPKRATGFFNRRRQIDPKMSTPIDEETLALRKVASNNQQRWRIGKKSTSNSSVTISDNATGKMGRHEASQRSSTRSSTSSDTGTANSRKSNGSIPSESPVVIKTKDSLKAKGAGRNALGARMEPFAVKVRSRNKSAKERDFSRLYLAQELSLISPIVSTAPSSVSSMENGASMTKKSSEKPSLSHLDSANSIASSTNSIGSVNSKRKATWAMKFSLDGKFLAIAGQDAIIRVYAVLDNQEAREKIEREADLATDEFDMITSRSCPFTSSSSHGSLSRESTIRSSISSRDTNNAKSFHTLPNLAVFQSEPVREFKGHSNDILELSWSKGGFLLSASMDKTARVWHMSWPNSLVSFVHGDFVTSAVFHPRDDRFFLSGSLDGKLRLWNITSKKVEYSQEVPGLITACAFTESGDTACVGTFAGHALFYCTEGLTYSSSIAVKSPSGKHAKGGRKITAIEPLFSAGKADDIISTTTNRKRGVKKGESVLITSNDSRVRAYHLGDKSMTARFKAKTYNNRTSQIRASVADDYTYVVAGSEATAACGEGGQVHIWDCSVITSDHHTMDKDANTKKNSIVTADSAVEYFTAHSSSVTCAIMAPLSTNVHLRASGDYIVRQSDVKLKSSRSISAMKDGAKNLENEAKSNRIIISVDESAVVRIWRSDSLHTVEV